MKTINLLATLALTTASLAACGVDPASDSMSATSAASDTFYVSRLGDSSKCVQAQQTSAGLIAILGNCSGISPTRVRFMSGTPYTLGVQAYVTISADGQCLTNPKGQAGAEDGRLLFKPCNDDGTEYGARQMFLINTNQNGALQIQSNLDLILGRSNPQSECLESPMPGVVKRQQCSNLHNWQLWR